MECPNVHIISPQVVALLLNVNEYLLTANEYYDQIPTVIIKAQLEFELIYDITFQFITGISLKLRN